MSENKVSRKSVLKQAKTTKETLKKELQKMEVVCWAANREVISMLRPDEVFKFALGLVEERDKALDENWVLRNVNDVLKKDLRVMIEKYEPILEKHRVLEGERDQLKKDTDLQKKLLTAEHNILERLYVVLAKTQTDTSENGKGAK